MRILVVGGTGEIGRRLVRRLLAAGHELVLYVRRPDRLDLPHGALVQVVEGDVDARAPVEAAAEGCEAAVYLAGWRRDDFAVPASERDEMRRIVVTGARVVAGAVRAAGVRRLVYTSSHLTLPETRLAEEGDYRLARRLAEGEIFHAGAQGLEVLVLCPAHCIGLDRGPLTRLLVDLASGRVPFYPDGTQISVVDADDVVEAHVQALHRGRPGARYLLMGGRVGWRQLGDMIGLATGWPVVLRPVGSRAANLAARFDASVLSRLQRRDPVADPARLDALTCDPGADGAAAARELGFEYHDVVHSLRTHLKALVEARRIGGD